MRLGLGLSLSGQSAPSAPSFDPATLNFSLRVEAAYAGSPWVGLASAGASNGRDLTEATNPPAVGTALNGYGTADFASSKFLGNSTQMSNFVANNAYSFAVLMNAASLPAATPTAAQVQMIVDDGGFVGVGAGSVTGTPTAFAYHFDSGNKFASATISLSSWTLVQTRLSGGSLKIRINGGAWSAGTAVSNLSASYATHLLRVGRSFNATVFYNQLMAAAYISPVALSDADFDNLRSYLNGKYGLSL